MVKHAVLASFIGLLFLIGVALTGGAFHQMVLPRFEKPAPPPPPPPPPKPKKQQTQFYSINPKRPAFVPQIAALPGTTLVRLAYPISNTHQGWALANMGKVTDPGSLFARHGITMQFRRLDRIADRIAALVDMATAFHRGDDTSGIGAHFLTLGGDTSSWTIRQVDEALKRVNSRYQAEILGFSGLSAGEDQLLGLADWKTNPQRALGGVVAGVPYDSAWSVMVLWCAQNEIPINADPDYYDPAALNVVEVDHREAAARLYVEKETVERIFLANGKDHRGRRVLKGEKRSVAIDGVLTRTPLDKRIAASRGGLVSIASTKQYPNLAPQFIVGLKQWNRRHRVIVTRMLAAVFEASWQIEQSRQAVKDGQLDPKADGDVGWRAAQYVQELLETESPEDWYAYYSGAEVQGKRGQAVNIGGVAVGNLQRNLLFFGLGQSGPDRGKVVYNRFAQLAKQYNPAFLPVYPEWEAVFTQVYVQDVLQAFPEMAKTDATLPTFALDLNPTSGASTFDLFFEVGSEILTPESEPVMGELLSQLARAGDIRIEIHGYADSYGRPENNLNLSRRRGEVVHRWLQEKLGVELTENARVIPHGEAEQLVEDQVGGLYIEELMAQNRRVVVKIFPRALITSKR